MNKSLTIETFTQQQTATGCQTIPASLVHPLLTKLHGDCEEEVPVIVEGKLDELTQRILEIAPDHGVAVLQVRIYLTYVEFDVCATHEWEQSNALDLTAALKEKGIPLTASWLPDGRIVLPSTAQGKQWSRFEPKAGRTKEQNIQAAADHVATLLPDPSNTFFNLKDFLDKNDAETPYGFGRGLYKYTACGPWTTFKLASGSGREGSVYYEDKRAGQSESEQDWWDQCIAIEICSIVEGSDVEIEPQYLAFPFTSKDLDDAVHAINAEADFYWKRDNTQYYSVFDAKGKYVLSCQWTDWDDKPSGNFEETDKKALKLAIAARKALDDPAANTLAEPGMRAIDYKHLVPIPGTKYFVREDETPDFFY